MDEAAKIELRALIASTLYDNTDIGKLDARVMADELVIQIGRKFELTQVGSDSPMLARIVKLLDDLGINAFETIGAGGKYGKSTWYSFLVDLKDRDPSVMVVFEVLLHEAVRKYNQSLEEC